MSRVVAGRLFGRLNCYWQPPNLLITVFYWKTASAIFDLDSLNPDKVGQPSKKLIDYGTHELND
jgi:hypothetical protein